MQSRTLLWLSPSAWDQLADSFKVHLLGSVAEAIQCLCVELEIIPPGCTGLVQPIDVGINKPFKANMRKIYTECYSNRMRTQPFRPLLA